MVCRYGEVLTIQHALPQDILCQSVHNFFSVDVKVYEAYAVGFSVAWDITAPTPYGDASHAWTISLVLL